MYRTILVPLDGSPLAERALGVATELATRLEAELRLVHVHNPAVVDELSRYGVTGNSVVGTAERYLERVVERLRATGGVRVTSRVIDGSPASAIVTHASAGGADLIVMASHGRTGASRFWLGSTADAIIRSAMAPVLMVRSSPEQPEHEGPSLFERILVPLDGSAVAEEVLPHALALGRVTRGEIHLLRVEEPAEALRTSVWMMVEQEHDDLAERLDASDHYLRTVVSRIEPDWAPATVTMESRGGRRIGETIATVATERASDLIAMTTHGRGASRLLLGSVADKVIRGTRCSILLLRSR